MVIRDYDDYDDDDDHLPTYVLHLSVVACGRTLEVLFILSLLLAPSPCYWNPTLSSSRQGDDEAALTCC